MAKYCIRGVCYLLLKKSMKKYSYKCLDALGAAELLDPKLNIRESDIAMSLI